ncbi:MAG: hypothetical protein HUU01_02210 [Saprospiraceae bacterium]|nr:hypothetical protein [Saprospiraceae bacterium]
MDINNFFSGFQTQDSYAILFITLIAFLLGLITAYLLRGAKIAELKKQLEEAKKRVPELETQLTAAQEQVGLKDADLKRAQFEQREAEARANRLEEEKNNRYAEELALNTEIERLRNAGKTQVATIEQLNAQIALLQANNEELLGVLAVSSPMVEPVGAAPVVEVPVAASVADDLTRQRLDLLEAKLAQLEAENQALQTSMQSLQTASVAAAAPIVATAPEEEEPEPVFVPGGKDVLREKIVVDAPPIEKDDLTLIVGIGPFLEKKLNELGIYTFDQISAFDAEAITRVTRDIGYFAGRIERDDWIGQAARLQKLKQEHPEALKPAVGPDVSNLQIIEGIGPKIDALLKSGGIATLHDLADAPMERLWEILDNAGEAYRIHDPETWATQARLAVRSEWELLREYQGELKGGRKVEE